MYVLRAAGIVQTVYS